MNHHSQAATAAAGSTPTPHDGPDEEAEDDGDGDPSRVKDEGPLESLGKAISEPIRNQAEEDAEEGPAGSSD